MPTLDAVGGRLCADEERSRCWGRRAILQVEGVTLLLCDKHRTERKAERKKAEEAFKAAARDLPL